MKQLRADWSSSHSTLNDAERCADIRGGSIVAQWRYDAWGNAIGGNVSVPALARLRYRFQGREWSAATGLVNFRMRWYDSETGRWLSKDPIGLGGGLNLYAFCENNPICNLDWIGLCPDEDDSSWIDQFQVGLDVIGAFDPTPISDGINAITHASRGKWGDAGISALGMVPYLGDIGKAGKYAAKVGKSGDRASGPFYKTSKEARDAAKRNGWKPVGGIKSKGEEVFTDGRN